MSAAMSPYHISRRRSLCRNPTIGRVRSAPSTRYGSTTARSARPTPMSRGFWIISTPARLAGIKTRKAAVVLGAGGAARAVIYGLLSRNVERLVVVNRTLARARRCNKNSASAYKRPAGIDWTPRSAMRRSSSTPRRSACRDSPALTMASRAACPSMRWSPIWFMRRCGPRCLQRRKARHLRTADGLGMLLHQAVRGFALWFGTTPAVTPELRAFARSRSRRSATLKPQDNAFVFAAAQLCFTSAIYIRYRLCPGHLCRDRRRER